MKYFLAGLLSTSVIVSVFLFILAVAVSRFVLEELLCREQNGRSR